MKAVTLVVMRRKLLDAYDHAGAAYSAMTDKEKERHVFEMLDAMSIAARVFSRSARVRLASTSSTVRAISQRAAQITSAST